MSDNNIVFKDSMTKRFLTAHPNYINQYSKLNQYDQVRFIHINRKLLGDKSSRSDKSSKSDEVDLSDSDDSYHHETKVLGHNRNISKLIKSFRHKNHDSKPRERDMVTQKKLRRS